MTSVLLIRHAQSEANLAGTLAGRAPGVGLTKDGSVQAGRLGERLAGVQIAQTWASPLERCWQTAQLAGLDPVSEPRLIEADYGSWTGSPLSELATEPLWRQIQTDPSMVTFPAGEAMQAMSDRAVAAFQDAVASGEPVVAMVSHADILKAILAHALGMPLDDFQRIVVSPASVSVIQAGEINRVWALNSQSGPVGELVPYLGHAER